MFKWKISSPEMDGVKRSSKKRSLKGEIIDSSIKRKLEDEESEENEPGKYVRLTKKNKDLKKKHKKNKLDNEEELDEALEELNFDKPSVLSGIKALFKVLEQKKSSDNQLLDLDTPIFLQLSSIKIPTCPSRTLRLPLKHSLHEDDSSVCFIVADVKGIIRKEYEKVSEHYEKLFLDKGVNVRIDKIMSFHELRNEYGEFEMKRKLLSMYDVFFVDGRISKYVSKHLGKIFRTKRRLPIPIALERGMSERMKYAMLRTSMNLHGNGNSYVVQVAHCRMDVERIFENVLSVCLRLSREFPGGWENVKVVNLKTDLSMAIPIYLSLKNANEVKVPHVKGRRPKMFKAVTDELSTRPNSNVTVYPSGDVVVADSDSPKKKRKRNRRV